MAFRSSRFEIRRGSTWGMPLNAYVIMDFWIATARLLVSLAVLFGCAWTWWLVRRGPVTSLTESAWLERRDAQFQRVVLLTMVLVVLQLAAWPWFYVVLNSFRVQQPEWICLFGVTQLGLGSDGPGQYLPRLVNCIEATRPLVVFCAGGWWWSYFAIRRSTEHLASSRMLAMGGLLGGLTTSDAACELAYLAINKQVRYVSTACCTAPLAGTSDSWLARWWGAEVPPAVWIGVTLAVQLVTCGLVVMVRCRWSAFDRPATWWGIALGAVGTAAFGIAALQYAVAPHLLGLPHHHCLYCLLSQVPETLVALVLLAGGAFAWGWASWLALAQVGAKASVDAWTRHLLVAGCWSSCGATALLAIAWGLAP